MAETKFTNRKARERIDEISSRMFHLTESLKVAAFACEARRVLRGVYDIAEVLPAFMETLKTQVPHGSHWEEMEDAASSLVQHSAEGLAQLNDEWTKFSYELTAGEQSHV